MSAKNLIIHDRMHPFLFPSATGCTHTVDLDRSRLVSLHHIYNCSEGMLFGVGSALCKCMTIDTTYDLACTPDAMCIIYQCIIQKAQRVLLQILPENKPPGETWAWPQVPQGEAGIPQPADASNTSKDLDSQASKLTSRDTIGVAVACSGVLVVAFLAFFLLWRRRRRRRGDGQGLAAHSSNEGREPEQDSVLTVRFHCILSICDWHQSPWKRHDVILTARFLPPIHSYAKFQVFMQLSHKTIYLIPYMW